MAMLLLLSGVEPGPTVSARSMPRHTLALVVLNVRSARRKAAMIHDVIDDNRQQRARHETWIPTDATNAIKLDACPVSTQLPGPAPSPRHVS